MCVSVFVYVLFCTAGRDFELSRGIDVRSPRRQSGYWQQRQDEPNQTGVVTVLYPVVFFSSLFSS